MIEERILIFITIHFFDTFNPPVVKYHVTVATADSPGAGTDQAIMVKLDGQMGSTGYRRLQDSTTGNRHFQQGQVGTGNTGDF